jgi:uncharacterized protein YjbI with pentapeptide repeats
MVSYIKSKVQQSLSFLLILVIAFSVFSGVLFLNPSTSYAYNEDDYYRATSFDRNLNDADLSGADFTDLDLSGADLNGANLREANLSRVDLSGANLIGADLSWADLNGANLNGANLNGANLSGARAYSNTKFPDGFDAVAAGVDILD